LRIAPKAIAEPKNSTRVQVVVEVFTTDEFGRRASSYEA
jgi:hypothetical protein